MTSPASSGLRAVARLVARLSNVAGEAVPRTSASDSQSMVNRAAAERLAPRSLGRRCPGGTLLITLRLFLPENSIRETCGMDRTERRPPRDAFEPGPSRV